MSYDDLFSYIFHWRVRGGACPKCLELAGLSFHHQTIFSRGLYNRGRLIYNFNLMRSEMHPNCKCYLDVEIEIDYSKITEFNDLLKMKLSW